MPYYYKTYYNHRIQQTLDDEMSRGWGENIWPVKNTNKIMKQQRTAKAAEFGSNLFTYFLSETYNSILNGVKQSIWLTFSIYQ